MELQQFQRRVVEEKKELDEKFKSLTAFYSTPTFHSLTESEQTLLLKQGVAMRNYSSILGERIAGFVA